jgi:hypothetical protein
VYLSSSSTCTFVLTSCGQLIMFPPVMITSNKKTHHKRDTSFQILARSGTRPSNGPPGYLFFVFFSPRLSSLWRLSNYCYCTRCTVRKKIKKTSKLFRRCLGRPRSFSPASRAHAGPGVQKVFSTRSWRVTYSRENPSGGKPPVLGEWQLWTRTLPPITRPRTWTPSPAMTTPAHKLILQVTHAPLHHPLFPPGRGGAAATNTGPCYLRFNFPHV